MHGELWKSQVGAQAQSVKQIEFNHAVIALVNCTASTPSDTLWRARSLMLYSGFCKTMWSVNVVYARLMERTLNLLLKSSTANQQYAFNIVFIFIFNLLKILFIFNMSYTFQCTLSHHIIPPQTWLYVFNYIINNFVKPHHINVKIHYINTLFV